MTALCPGLTIIYLFLDFKLCLPSPICKCIHSPVPAHR